MCLPTMKRVLGLSLEIVPHIGFVDGVAVDSVGQNGLTSISR